VSQTDVSIVKLGAAMCRRRSAAGRAQRATFRSAARAWPC